MGDILGIDKVIYGVDDLTLGSRFFSDWGLRQLESTSSQVLFETLEGAQIALFHKDDASLPAAIEEGPTVRQLIWAVASDAALTRLQERLKMAGFQTDGNEELLTCKDPAGLSIGFKVAARRKLSVRGSATNAYGRVARVNQPSPIYEKAEPVRLSHVVFYTDILDQHVGFYVEQLGFHVSDSYPGQGVFLRCQEEGGHHDLFLLNSPQKPKGLNHVSFGVRDVYEVFGGGIHMNSLGWETQIGPGRHPISSAVFWYVKCPCGALTEYYADEDYLTADWKPREFQRTAANFAEWSVLGGIDSKTRHQRG